MRFAFERLRLVVEPLLRREPELVGQRVGVVVTERSVDSLTFFERLVAG